MSHPAEVNVDGQIERSNTFHLWGRSSKYSIVGVTYTNHYLADQSLGIIQRGRVARSVAPRT